MSTRKRTPHDPARHRLDAGQLRWRCDPKRFPFKTTQELGDCPINIIGQPRAEEALRLGLSMRSEGYNVFVSGAVGSGRSTVVRQMLADVEPGRSAPDDLVYVHNFEDPDQPRKLVLPAGRGKAFKQTMDELVDSLASDLPKLFESDTYRKRRAARVESAGAKQKALLREFEKRVQEQGFTLVQVQMGPLVRPQLVPVVAGNPVDMDQLEALVEQDKFEQEDYQKLREKEAELRGELELVSKEVRVLWRELREQLNDLDRELAKPMVEEAVGEVRAAFFADGLEHYLAQVLEDILKHLQGFREGDELPEASAGEEKSEPGTGSLHKYQVNVIVDNGQTQGRPVIWETAPSYRNLFGTIERVRGDQAEWETDHTRIKAGSLVRANGGFLVLDALDVLVEPQVWAALKRTLRHRKVEIQSFDPLLLFTGTSLKPEPIPIDVKVVMIGTHYIYRLLYAMDEDFKKIFKVKADFAMYTQRNDGELMNYACLVHKRCQEERLPPFHRDAVAAVVEQAVRMAEHHEKLTTRFSDVVDLIREAGYWAKQDQAKQVRAEHVERAVAQRVHRVDLIEEMLRERITEGTVLLDLDGAKIGQVNGLAVLDLGDYMFAVPARITATTAMGRAGIIDIDRESEMSGSIHTKGVLILTGFLRSHFAQDKPLALTATLCFEQGYGGVEGDSASAAELYALLSSLAAVPLRQGVALTGSVNQRGEIQPIGGVNEKIEGFFDLCRIMGLTGEQGVMIPRRNLNQLMLREDLVAAVREGRFHVWAVSTVAEGLEVLTGLPTGEREEDGTYPPESVFGRADARLRDLAEQVRRYGVADGGAVG